MIKFSLIILFSLLVSCKSSEIKVTDPVTGQSGYVKNETFYKGIVYIQRELKPLLLKYYEQHNDIPKNIEDFNSVEENNFYNLSKRYCSINTKHKGSFVYISVSLREEKTGCTNQIFWDVALNDGQDQKTLTREDIESIIQDELNNPYR